MSSFFELEDRYLASLFQKFKVCIVRGKNELVWDSNGKEYIDCLSGYGVAIAGHCNDYVVNAVRTQAEKLITCHGSFYNDSRAEFLENLASITPKGLDSFILTNSGAESVEAAIKLARKKTGRKKIISMKGAFHGKTFGALSATWNKKYREAFEPLLDGFYFSDYNADSVEKLIDKDTAAIITESVQGESGVIIPEKDFLPRLRELCDKYGSMLIVDEIQTGLGRTGKFWGFEHSNTVPDIFTVAKGLAGGLPIGCVVTKSEISSSFSRGEHTSTFAGNPLCCAAGSALIKYLKEKNLPERARTLGEKLSSILKQIKEDNKIIRDVRSIGLMAAVQTRFDVYNVLIKSMNEGVIFGYSGRDTVRMLPPLVINEEKLGLSLKILDTILREEERSKIGQVG